VARHAKGIGLVLGVLVVLGAGAFGAWKWMNNRAEAPEQESATEGTPIELTMADPLESRPSESLAVAIDAVDPPEIEERAELPSAEASEEPPPSTAQPSPSGATSRRSTVERGREEYEIAAEKAKNRLYEQAIEDLDEILRSDPSLSVEADALSLRAGIEESQGRIDDALATYTEIGTRFEGRKLQVWARYNFGRLLLRSDRPNKREASLDVFEEVARVWPNSEYAADALASKASVEDDLKLRVRDEQTGKRVSAAFVTSRTLVQRYPNDPAAEQAFWIVGQQYEDLKEWQQAADAYWKLGTGFPNTDLDAWWKAGQIYDRRLDDSATAVRAYQQVAEGSEHYDEAQKRIQRLSR
jgi:tetratricopeptide (TPR) repeat protein